MAVEDRAARQPNMIPSCTVRPMSTPMPAKAATVRSTCAVPPIKTGRFRRMSSAQDARQEKAYDGRNLDLVADEEHGDGKAKKRYDVRKKGYIHR